MFYLDASTTMKYKSVMGCASIELLEDEEKEKAMDEVFMARYEETKNFEYHKQALKVTAIAKLTVLELSAKGNL